MLEENTYSSLMSKLSHYAKKICGTSSYWIKAKNDLKAIIFQKGPPTIFWTLRCADFHWPEFHGLFENRTNDSRNNVLMYPHILDWIFTERNKKFVKQWLYKCLDAKWHWCRYEFAVQRGCIHYHGVAKLKSNPGLREFSILALKGHLAENFLKENIVQK